ncbi:MAG: class I SAM-dependent methyltransferase [Candidatus Thorarchaeota archaeon]
MISPILSSKTWNKIRKKFPIEPDDKVFFPLINDPLNLESFLKLFPNRIIASIPNYTVNTSILQNQFLVKKMVENQIEINMDFFGLSHEKLQQDVTKIIITFPSNLALSLVNFALHQVYKLSKQPVSLLIITSNKKQEEVILNWVDENYLNVSKIKIQKIISFIIPEFHPSKSLKRDFEDYTYRIEYNKTYGKFEFFSSDEVFSKDKIDDGTNFLIDTIICNNLVSSNAEIIDYFSGIGVIGIILSKLFDFSTIHFIESDLLSLYSLKKNLELHNIEDAIVHEIDGLKKSSITPGTVDYIIANPPTHIKKEEFKIFLKISKSLLKNKGKLIIVINRIIPYEETLKEYFPNPSNFITYYKDNYKIIVNY